MRPAANAGTRPPDTPTSPQPARRLRVDKQADALPLRLDSSDIVESVEAVPGVVLGHNDNEKVVGVEMLRLSTGSTGLDLSDLHFEAV